VDFYPTLIELAGATPDSDQKLDGKSLVKILTTPSEIKERSIFWHYPVYHHDVPKSVIRKGDFKLIENLVDGSLELYDLANDISEATNLIESMPEKASELYDSLKVWQEEVNATFPSPNPDFDPARRQEWGRHPDMR
jgi:uncharacterized sulfatase